MAKRSECYENQEYEAKDENELLRSIDEDPDKLKGWEGSDRGASEVCSLS